MRLLWARDNSSKNFSSAKKREYITNCNQFFSGSFPPLSIAYSETDSRIDLPSWSFEALRVWFFCRLNVTLSLVFDFACSDTCFPYAESFLSRPNKPKDGRSSAVPFKASYHWKKKSYIKQTVMKLRKINSIYIQKLSAEFLLHWIYIYVSSVQKFKGIVEFNSFH